MITVAITTYDSTQNGLIIEGTLTLSGTYGAAAGHGDIVDFSTFDSIKSNSVPRLPVTVSEAPPAGTAPTGYLFNFCAGTTLANGKLSIFNNLTEFTQGSAYDAGLLAAVVVFRAFFPSFV